ncbi:hypothetical protein [Tritonibacter mobilis]|uniref:hypothetical protein n=1 Tax=Tritonibacter mobilis TaxID=379347 RepID=UPI000806C988|nr:hypothetical protein [Tritonibacter mobilis]
MPELIKLYIRSALWGLVLAAIFVGILLWFNIANLGALVFGSDAGVVAVLALWISNAVVFGGVQFGFKIMAMAEREAPPRGGTWVGPELQAVPVPAKAAQAGRPTKR